MAKERHLANAPIVEAIIDIRVELPSDYDVTKFESLRKTLGETYPKVEESHSYESGVRVKDKQIQQVVTDKGLRGYFFKSPDGKNVGQFRRDGFTFNRLTPYTNWETVLSEAKILWKLYVKTATPELVTRLATRYINRMDIPLPIDDFSRYLTAPPNIPKGLPEGVSHFLTIVSSGEARGLLYKLYPGGDSERFYDYLTNDNTRPRAETRFGEKVDRLAKECQHAYKEYRSGVRETLFL
jgi:uncharacterized protein (TIGR04255 family)